MIYFGVSRQLKMKPFISWNKCVDIIFTNEVIKGYTLIQKSSVRNEKTAFYDI